MNASASIIILAEIKKLLRKNWNTKNSVRGAGKLRHIKKLRNKNMMDYNMMGGAGGGSMMFFAWIIYTLTTVVLVLGIIALWKYINKK